MNITVAENEISQLLNYYQRRALRTFWEISYQIFIWNLATSVLIHFGAALISFSTLRKHKYGKFFPVIVLMMGFLVPLTSGLITSMAIAFIYRMANFSMSSINAFLWGTGYTIFLACFGFTRILATL